MIYTLVLPPSDDTLSALSSQYLDLLAQAKAKGLPPAAFTPIGDALRAWLENQPASAACLQAAAQNSDHRTLMIRSDNPEWLNLPWRLGVGEFPWVHVIGSSVLTAKPETSSASIPLPFRILVMISAPVDLPEDKKLNHEAEEMRILNSLSPLIEEGKAFIDFTEDGSLNALERKLAERPYHVLHFSGHGTYHNGKGYLLLEEPDTLKKKLTQATDFVATLTRTAANIPPLVVLSACKTAQGKPEIEQTGVASALVKAGVSSVIAMNESIRDDYATVFASRLYEFLSKGEPIHNAFKTAYETIRGLEYKEYQGRKATYQWLIPELIYSSVAEKLFDLKGKSEDILINSPKFQISDSEIKITKEAGYSFVGRRKERSQLLSALTQGKPVLLRGMGGVGKTALAAQLIHTLSESDPHLIPLILNETSFKLTNIFPPLLNLLPIEHKRFIESQLQSQKEIGEQTNTLLRALKNVHIRVGFVFDNLETFQSGPEKPFKEEYVELEKVIRAIALHPYFPMILTARYPIAGINNLFEQDLHQSSLNDFLKKSLHTRLYKTYLDLKEHSAGNLSVKINPQSEVVTFLSFTENLYRVLGGNFRLLEYFDGIISERPGQLEEGLKALSSIQPEMDSARKGMETDEQGHQLAFAQLINLLNPEEKTTLVLLACFRIPVGEIALGKQEPQKDFLTHLENLSRTTLVERHTIHGNLILWYVVPLVKEYLKGINLKYLSFSHESAGNYYHKVAPSNLLLQGLEQQEEAFYHYCLSGNEEQVATLGDMLSEVFHNVSLYHQARLYAETAGQMAGDKISTKLRNRLGLLFRHFGEYSRALKCYEENLPRYREIGDKSGEGPTLNNLSQIFQARGDYETALQYLEQSLRIAREIGDKSGEGTTLNNISGIYQARGDYETALQYLEQSLRIAREIGDKSGEGRTLNNLSQIFQARGDYETALQYLEQSLRIRREIGDKSGEGSTLNNLSQIFQARGDYETALQYLEQSLRIAREIGDKSGEGTTLNNLATTAHARGDYETALLYLEQSLRIQREIGDKSGEGTTLNNLSQIFHARGDYETALLYLEQSLRIAREIGDKSGEGRTLNNLATTAHAKGDYETALLYLEQSLRIRREIGDINGLAITLNNMAVIIFQQQGKPEEALPLFIQSYSIFHQIGSPNEKVPMSYINDIVAELGEARFQEIVGKIKG
ncbi:MAG: tetratricopeptide repeat protein [Bacteroidia bacterium]|nr:tetratricopeptide repeat protein [Bacteroidia bacterium]